MVIKLLAVGWIYVSKRFGYSSVKVGARLEGKRNVRSARQNEVRISNEKRTFFRFARCMEDRRRLIKEEETNVAIPV